MNTFDDGITFTQRVYQNGMLGNHWSLAKTSDEPILFNIPNCQLVFDYNGSFNTITIMCNEFVVKRIGELIAKIKESPQFQDLQINCIKDYRNSKQLNLRLPTDHAKFPSISSLKRNDHVEVTFEARQISCVNNKYYLTMFLTEVKKLS